MTRTTDARSKGGTIECTSLRDGAALATSTFERGELMIVRGRIPDTAASDATDRGARIALDGEPADVAVRADLARGTFVAVVSTLRLSIGSHTLSLFGPAESSSAFAGAAFAVAIVPEADRAAALAFAPGRFIGCIDSWVETPTDIDTLDVLVRGWAYDVAAGEPVPTISFAGALEGRSHALLGFPRPDVAASFDDERMTAAGFRVRFSRRRGADGELASELDVASSDARARGCLACDAVFEDAARATLAPAYRQLEADVLSDVAELDRSLTNLSSGFRIDDELGIDTQSPVYSFPDWLTDNDVSAMRHYEATPFTTIEAVLDAIPFDPSGSTFVDFGCGKGRTLLSAMRRPFAKVVGVEINPELAEIARANLERADPAGVRARSSTVVDGDVTDFALPSGDLVAFLYNPFDDRILEPLVRRLAAADCERVAIVYINPVHRSTIEANGSFDRISSVPDGELYLRRGREQRLPLEFEPDMYRLLNPDLEALGDDELVEHYAHSGTSEGRRAHRIAARDAFAALVPPAADALEIGPYFRPLLRGRRTRYFDVMSGAELRERATADGIDGSLIPEIDFVSPTGNLDVVAGAFDYVLSSHALEHQPDLISHVRGVERLLRPGGRYFLLVPDKRYCFDHFSPESTFAEIVEAYHQRRTTHSLRSILGQSVMTTHNDCVRHWNGDHGTFLENAGPRTRAGIEEFEAAGGAYLDVHGWYFTPESARAVFSALAAAKFIELEVERLYPTLRNTDEFWLVLKR